MSRLLNGTTEYIGAEVAAVSGGTTAKTFSAWVYPTTLDSTQRTIISIGDETPASNFLNRTMLDGSVNHFAATQARDGTEITNVATGTTSLQTNQWFHICGIIVLGASNVFTTFIYTNGKDKQTATNGSTNTATPAAGTNTTAGTLKRAAELGELFWAGRIADAAIWNVQLTDLEVAALAAGTRPLMIRPSNLKLWWPLDGIIAPEPDLSLNKIGGTLTGTLGTLNGPYAPQTPRWPQRNSMIMLPAAGMGWLINRRNKLRKSKRVR